MLLHAQKKKQKNLLMLNFFICKLLLTLAPDGALIQGNHFHSHACFVTLLFCVLLFFFCHFVIRKLICILFMCLAQIVHLFNLYPHCIYGSFCVSLNITSCTSKGVRIYYLIIYKNKREKGVLFCVKSFI